MTNHAAVNPKQIPDAQDALDALLASRPTHDTASAKAAPPQRNATLASAAAQTTPGEALERFKKYAAKCPDSISGQKGHPAFFRLVCEAVRFGLLGAELEQAVAWLNSSKCVPPWSPGELQHKITDAIKEVTAKGEVGIRLRSTLGDFIASKAGNQPAQRRPLTDAGNGERFAEQHRNRFRYDTGVGAWRVWTGKRWELDHRGEVFQAAKATARSIYPEAATAKDTDEAKAIASHATKSESRDRAEAMLRWARTEQGMSITPDQWDADDYAFNVLNGTLDMHTGTLCEHNPDDLITKIAPVVFDPDAECPLFLAFVNRIFAGDAALIEYVRRLLGMCTTGDIKEQIAPVGHGEGANGKSTLLELMQSTLGDYAGNAPPDLLLSRKGNEHPTEIAGLKGLRLVVASESERGRKLKLQLIKRLTGDATLTARLMHQNYITFRRTFKIILVTNNKPHVDEDTEAAWRRLKLLPFTVVIPPAERDPHLGERLWGEAPGILNWLIGGCLAWQREGLGEPDAVVQATSDYRAESDPLGGFISTCCLVADNAWVEFRRLRTEYEDYCKEQGDQPISGKDFTDALRRHGATDKRRHSGRGWSGIGLLANNPQEVNP